MFETPILLIVFNRPQTTQKVFDEIKKIKPKYLFVGADGPRANKPDDLEKCSATRNIFKKIDWDCELKTLFRDENRGCGLGPSETITWFFSHVDEGIILEDDCLPHPEFFCFCSKLLEYYRQNSKIYFIGGTNFQNEKNYGNASYYFSAGNQGTWGWATWRRAWKDFDYYLHKIDREQIEKKIIKLFPDRRQQTYWFEIFFNVKFNQYNNSCWDYQFYFKMWIKDGFAIIPNVNLISNIGFGEDATHTGDKSHPFSEVKTESILPLIHPKLIIQNKKADFYLHKTFIQPNEYDIPYILWWIRKKIVLIKKSILYNN